jgi:cysteine sulfinate desulfinase/cysteine desulfurase-like protein
MGIEPELAHGSLRLTAGRDTTAEQVARTIEVTQAVVGRLRDFTAPRPAVASV